MMAGGEAFKRPATMLSEAAHQVARHADIECARTIAGHDIDTGLAFLGHDISYPVWGGSVRGRRHRLGAARRVTARWMPDQVRHDRNVWAPCDISCWCRLYGARTRGCEWQSLRANLPKFQTTRFGAYPVTRYPGCVCRRRGCGPGRRRGLPGGGVRDRRRVVRRCVRRGTPGSLRRVRRGQRRGPVR